MLRTAAVTLLLSWIVGWIAVATGGGLIHVLLALTVAAIVFETFRMVRG
jgi:hypothetical protein